MVRTIGAESRIRTEGPIGTLFEVHKMSQVESRKTPGTFKQGSRSKPGRSPAIDHERAMTLPRYRSICRSFEFEERDRDGDPRV